MKFQMKIALIFGSLSLVSCGSSNDILKGDNSENIRCSGGRSENSNPYGGGDGTQEDPYLVCSVNQFKMIQGDMNKKRFFKLTSDLDFSNESNLRIVAISPFASIDGAGHKLQNITIRHGQGYKSNGIFGQLVKDLNGNRDEIKNLIIENVKIIGDGLEDSGGVIAAANWEGIISNVHVSGEVRVEYPESAPSEAWSVGGLVGTNASLIEDSSFEGKVSGTYNVGGIAGLNWGIIRNSRATGSVKGSTGVGGITGVQLKAGSCEKSTSAAKITGDHFSGPLTGHTCEFNNYSQCGIRSDSI